MTTIIICDNCDEHIPVDQSITMDGKCKYCGQRYAGRDGKVMILEIEGAKTWNGAQKPLSSTS